jgi:hypothetical protein
VLFVLVQVITLEPDVVQSPEISAELKSPAAELLTTPALRAESVKPVDAVIAVPVNVVKVPAAGVVPPMAGGVA